MSSKHHYMGEKAEVGKLLHSAAGTCPFSTAASLLQWLSCFHGCSQAVKQIRQITPDRNMGLMGFSPRFFDLFLSLDYCVTYVQLF